MPDIFWLGFYTGAALGAVLVLVGGLVALRIAGC